jgi:ribosomal protein S18 acetylase RimI-like enzyme
MEEYYAEAGLSMESREAAASFARLLREPARGAVRMIEAGGGPAGYVVRTLGFSLEYGGLDAFVDDLFVRRNQRRRGHARAALEALLEECRRRGVRAVHLEVDRANEPARALYELPGFRGHGRELWTARIPPEREPGRRA